MQVLPITETDKITGTHSSAYEVQFTIDNEIADLIARLQQHEHAPASKLPDDVLLHIFLILRDLSVLDVKNWLQATQVCGHWRHVGVGSALLWTRLHNPPPALIPLMLERSHDAPLDVSLSENWHRNPGSIETLTIILHQIKRIQKLAIKKMPVAILETVHAVFEKLGRDWEASLLECFTASVETDSPRDPLSLSIFRPTRLLRDVRILAGCYDWGMLSLPSLTSLTHLGLYGQPIGGVSGTHFMETLRQMHSLEYLGFTCDHQSLCHFASTPSHPIFLPYLRELVITGGRQADHELFLSLLLHPKLDRLVVFPSIIDTLTLFIRSILFSVEKGDFGPLDLVRITRGEVSISRNSWPTSESYVHMLLDYGVEDDFDIVKDIISCLTPFDYPDKLPLRHLYLDNWDIPIDEFIHMFASLPHLETIEICDKLALVLFDALETPSASVGASPIPFPQLQSITWDGRNIYGFPLPHLSVTAFSALCECLRSRRSYGAALTRLELVGCEQLQDSQVGQLNEIGVEIVIRNE